jgi:SAM-dependent methyltransferase
LCLLRLSGIVGGSGDGGLMGWEQSGRAWGARAADWAYLVEPYARAANDVVFDQTGVGEGTRYLDVACGSGFAAWTAARRGAEVSGLDASEDLLAIARSRTPAGDFRLGDMFALPFADGTFDVATSFNGIWAGCDKAVAEARRVLRPGGSFGMTFWGRVEHIGLVPYFATILALSPPSHGEATMSQASTGNPGVAEAMLEGAGLEVTGRGTVDVVNEWPDVELAVRGLVAAGPSVPAVEHAGPERFAAALAEALAPLDLEGVGVRITSEFAWLTARAPS